MQHNPEPHTPQSYLPVGALKRWHPRVHNPDAMTGIHLPEPRVEPAGESRAGNPPRGVRRDGPREWIAEVGGIRVGSPEPGRFDSIWPQKACSGPCRNQHGSPVITGPGITLAIHFRQWIEPTRQRSEPISRHSKVLQLKSRGRDQAGIAGKAL